MDVALVNLFYTINECFVVYSNKFHQLLYTISAPNVPKSAAYNSLQQMYFLKHSSQLIWEMTHPFQNKTKLAFVKHFDYLHVIKISLSLSLPLWRGSVIR